MARKPGKSAASAPAVPTLSAGLMDNHALLYRHKAFPFVRRGTIYGFALAEALAKPAIPPGESAIVALTALASGLAYGLTAGERGHAFYFHPAFGVTHLGLVGEGEVTGGAVADVGNDEIVVGWRGPSGGGLFRHACAVEAGQGLEQFRGAVAPLVPLPPLPAGDGIAALVREGDRRTVFGLTSPGGFLVRVDLEPAEVTVLARIEGAASVLVRLPDGALVGACNEGQLWRFDPGSGALAALPAVAPCQMGKRYVAGVQSLLLSRSGLVYGGTSTDGYLFTWDPASGALVNLGKPVRQSNVRALTEGHDALVYGIAEEPGGLAHLFAFDPGRRGFTDLGLVGSAFPENWHAHSIGCLSTGPFGEVFLGETDRISHVFVYYPPVCQQPVGA
jgi:hypothetical protein